MTTRYSNLIPPHFTFPTKSKRRVDVSFVNRRASTRYDVFDDILIFPRNFKFSALVSPSLGMRVALKSARVRGNDTISTARRARYGYPAFTGFYTSYRVYVKPYDGVYATVIYKQFRDACPSPSACLPATTPGRAYPLSAATVLNTGVRVRFLQKPKWV